MAAPSILGRLPRWSSGNPVTARLRFKLRSFTNALVVVAVFVPGALMLSGVSWGWLGQLALILVLFCGFFYVLEHRAIWIRCPHCRKPIKTNTPWECGFCGKLNQNANSFPFVHHCEHCATEPKAYRCHHGRCGELIFLTADEQESNFAQCGEAPVCDTTEQESNAQARERRAKEHELAMAELDEKLEAFRQRKEFSKPRSPKEAIRADYEKGHATFLGVEEFADMRLKEITDLYKEDPGRLGREKAWLDVWRKRRIPQ